MRTAPRDIDLAKRKLAEEKFNVVIVKRGKTVFTSRASGVRSLIEAVKEFGQSLAGASVADRVVGKAAALVCVYAKISFVYASMMSEPGLNALQRFSVSFEYRTLVRSILDRCRTDVCPFEQLVSKIDSPEKAFLTIERQLASSG